MTRPWQPRFPKYGGGRPRFNTSSSSAGRAPDIAGGAIWFRSMWERNFARYLELMVKDGEIAGWAFEPQTFWFDGIRRGTTSYKPDFRIDENDGSHWWAEVKGWLDDQSKVRLKRMAKYHPTEKVVVIGPEWFKAARTSWALIIPNWERGERPATAEPVFKNAVVAAIVASRAGRRK